MVASHMIWLFRTRGIRKRAKEAGETFEEFEEGAEWQAKGIDIEKKIMHLFSKRTGPCHRWCKRACGPTRNNTKDCSEHSRTMLT